MKEADFYTVENGQVHCRLCPHHCRINEGKRGICRVRKNSGGKLVAETYGQVCSMGFDPIEKKPLYHFFPGNLIFSVGSIGCNMHCHFCQNWEISQSSCDDFNYLRHATPDEIVSMARQNYKNTGIAYTYNEPSIWYEYMMDIAKPASEEGLKNVMVTNGFITAEALKASLLYIDAYSVDLKGFSNDFYKRVTHSRLEPILENLELIRKSGRHLEITHLVITNQNDNPAEFEAMVTWIAEKLGRDTVLHISRYFPNYQLDEPSTSEKLLLDFFETAKHKLDYVYLGNMRSGKGQHTHCPVCQSTVIERTGYTTQKTGLTQAGACKFCRHQIINQEHIT